MPNGTTELGIEGRCEIVLGLSGELKAVTYIVDGNRSFERILAETKEDVAPPAARCTLTKNSTAEIAR